MVVDTDHIEESLKRALADVAFWEDARRLLTDPRIAGALNTPSNPRATSLSASSIPYSVLRDRVMQVIAPFGAKPMSSGDIVKALADGGYPITTKQPGVTVNDALVTLERAGKVLCAHRHGIAKFWTKTQMGGEEEILTSEVKEQTPTEVGV